MREELVRMLYPDKYSDTPHPTLNKKPNERPQGRSLGFFINCKF